MQAVLNRWGDPLRRCRAATLLIILSGTACHEWRTEDVAPKIVLSTRQPANVRVTRIDGSQLLLEHAVLQGDTLSGDTLSGDTLSGVGPRGSELRHVTIPLTDVRQIATRVPSAGRTLGLGLGVAAGLAAAYGVFLAISLANCSGCH